MEQSQRLGSTMPSGRSSSSSTAPQWHVARCLAWMVTPPTPLSIRGPLPGMAFSWVKPGGVNLTGSLAPVWHVLKVAAGEPRSHWLDVLYGLVLSDTPFCNPEPGSLATPHLSECGLRHTPSE